jgi:hypothetical protein
MTSGHTTAATPRYESVRPNDILPPSHHSPLSSARKRWRKLSANLNLFKKQEQKSDEEL